MRLLLPTLLLFVCAAGAHAQTTTLRIVDWNVHHDGVGTDGIADLGRITAWLAPRSPHVVTMNEISAAAVADLERRLEMATGAEWYGAQFGDGGGEGEGILSRFPITATATHWMEDHVRKALQVSLDVNGRTVNVIATHLRNGDFPDVRAEQVQELLAFASQFAEPRVIAGDINAAPDYAEIQPLYAAYVDAWEDARQQGRATAYPDNPVTLFTRTQWKRIDHILASERSAIHVTGCDVPDQRDLSNTAVAVTIGTTDDRGVRPSDHNLLSCSLELTPFDTTPDTTSPQIGFSAPSADAPLTRVVPFVVTASDDVSVARVEFRVDGRLLHVDRWAPYEYGWRTDTMPPGAHTITAAAFDRAGNQRSVSRSYTVADPAGTTTRELVLYAADALVQNGAWSIAPDAEAAGGRTLQNPDAGAAKVDVPLAAPPTYFELTFPAEAGVPYRLWIRGRAAGNSPLNDSVWVQYSGSVTAGGVPAWRINTTEAQSVNLEDYAGAGLSAAGWQDDGYGAETLGQQVYFASTGIQTVRIQPREDGFSLDQVVISAGSYLGASPGGTKNDHTILTRTVLQPASMPGGQAPNVPPSVSLTSPRSGGKPFTAPATIELAATATDSDGTIARVEFYAGTTRVATDTSSPFSAAWTDVPDGTYSLTARAVDDRGSATTSAAISVQVKKAPKGRK